MKESSERRWKLGRKMTPRQPSLASLYVAEGKLLKHKHIIVFNETVTIPAQSDQVPHGAFFMSLDSVEIRISHEKTTKS